MLIVASVIAYFSAVQNIWTLSLDKMIAIVRAKRKEEKEKESERMRYKSMRNGKAVLRHGKFYWKKWRKNKTSAKATEIFAKGHQWMYLSNWEPVVWRVTFARFSLARCFRSFIQPFVRSFARSFIHLPVRSCVRLLHCYSLNQSVCSFSIYIRPHMNEFKCWTRRIMWHYLRN